MRRLFARSLEMLVLSLVALLSVGGSIGEAVDPNAHLLMGDYHFSRTRTCIRASSGFDTNNELALMSAGTIVTDTSQGTIHYNGDGTGSLTGQLLQINHSQTAIGNKPVTQLNITCDLTYVVHPDDTFTDMLTTCTSLSIAGAGSNVGLTVTTIGTERKGLFANGRNSFVFGNVNPHIITTTLHTPGGDVVNKLICSSSGTAFKSN